VYIYTPHTNKKQTVVIPEANDGILPMVAAVVDESVDVLTTDGVVTMEWLQTMTEGLATG